jgi:hypothetical protein
LTRARLHRVPGLDGVVTHLRLEKGLLARDPIAQIERLENAGARHDGDARLAKSICSARRAQASAFALTFSVGASALA